MIETERGVKSSWWRSWDQNKENISPYRVVQSPILQPKVVWWLMRNRITGYRCHCYCARWFHSSLIRSPHWYSDDGSQKPARCHIRDRQQKSPRRDKWVSVRVVHELEMWPIQGSETERQEIGKSIKLTDNRNISHTGVGWKEFFPRQASHEGRGERDTWSSPSSVIATVEVCQPWGEDDRWRQLRGPPPAAPLPILRRRRGGLWFRTVTNHIYK